MLNTTLSQIAPNATIILAGAAGLLTPFVTQVVKKFAGVDGQKALMLTVIISVVMSAGAAFISGEATSFGDLIKLMPWVFTQATILYKLYYPKGNEEV
jgi:hypothetical protein